MSISSIYQAKKWLCAYIIHLLSQAKKWMEKCVIHLLSQGKKWMETYIIHLLSHSKKWMDTYVIHLLSHAEKWLDTYIIHLPSQAKKWMDTYIIHLPSQAKTAWIPISSIYQAKPKLHGYLYHPSTKPSQNCMDTYIIHLPSQAKIAWIPISSIYQAKEWMDIFLIHLPRPKSAENLCLEGFRVLNPRPALATRLVDKEGNTQASHKHAQPNSRASSVFCERGSHGEFGVCSCANRARKKQSRRAAIVFPRTVFEFLF